MSPLQKLIQQDERRLKELTAANDEAIERVRQNWQRFLDDWHKPNVIQFERNPDEGLL